MDANQLCFIACQLGTCRSAAAGLSLLSLRQTRPSGTGDGASPQSHTQAPKGWALDRPHLALLQGHVHLPQHLLGQRWTCRLADCLVPVSQVGHTPACRHPHGAVTGALGLATGAVLSKADLRHCCGQSAMLASGQGEQLVFGAKLRTPGERSIITVAEKKHSVHLLPKYLDL